MSLPHRILRFPVSAFNIALYFIGVYSRQVFALTLWRRGGFSMPAPTKVKWAVLSRYSNSGSIWVETGTFTGLTTKYLSNTAKHVYSIEPEPILAQRALKKFAKRSNVSIIQGLSEDVFLDLLKNLSGNISFWLDGHYSAGVTHQGPIDTPIREELEAISKVINQFDSVSIFIDDVRCFNPKDKGFEQYPDKKYLVDWASGLGLDWFIEQDIFICRK